MKLMSLLPVFFLLAISCCSMALSSEPAKKNPVEGPFCNSQSGGKTPINESRYVNIGGIDQWITVAGTDCANPVVLIVHGGPGNPLSLYSQDMYKNWLQEFTVVHWDQRGAGKTFEKNQNAVQLTAENLNQEALSLDILVSDGVAVTDYVRKKFDTEKIIISGISWGSVLALSMVHKAPEKFYFYVGLSQLVNYHKNMDVSYDLVLSRSVKDGNKNEIETLKSIGHPPWKDPRSFGKMRRIIRAYESRDASHLPRLEAGKEYISEKSKAAYVAGEDFSYVKFVGLEGNGIAQQIALDKCCTKFKVPIYLIQGDKDLLTVARVTKHYFKKIKAPTKKYINVEDAGHDPNLTMLNVQLSTLRDASRKIGIGKP